MERRKFLKYGSLAAVGLTAAACNSGNWFGDRSRDRTSDSSESADFGKLEKTYLTLGIVPVTNCAPLVIAQEKGFFERYGLTVGFSKKANWDVLQEGLLDGSLDGAQAPFGMPMLAQLGAEEAPMVSLMLLNVNDGSITLAEKAWQAGIRSSLDYFSFQDFADSYRKYLRRFEEPPGFGIDSPGSMANYLSRYWFSAIGINPDLDLELAEIPPSQMIFKLQAGEIGGYSVGSPWNQLAVREKAGFVTYVNRDIWQGHPGYVLATMEPWIEENPTTARALVAAILEACQFCDRPENTTEIAQILSDSRYVDAETGLIQSVLGRSYDYGGFDGQERVVDIPDYTIFHFQETDYLKKPDSANYPWQSYGTWLLTQMIRWNQLDLYDYPKDADERIEQIYPVEIYEEVAKALNLEIPSDRMKVEPPDAFIDRQQFDPSEPVAYLNKFDIRANRPRQFALG